MQAEPIAIEPLAETLTELDTVQELQDLALEAEREARSIVIASDSEYQEECLKLKHYKACMKQVEEFFGPDIADAHKLHKSLCAKRSAILAPWQEAERLSKRAIGAYSAEQDRLRLAADAEARQLAEAAERERQEEASVLSAFGSDEEAAQVLAAAPVLAALQEAVTPKAEGVSIRKRWTFELVDASKLRPEFLVPDTSKIQKVVNALKGDAAMAVGEGAITVQEVSDVAVRV